MGLITGPSSQQHLGSNMPFNNYLTCMIYLASLTPLVTGGRYSSPDELPKLVGPLAVTGLILVGLLAVLAYFQCRKKNFDCACVYCRQLFSKRRQLTGEEGRAEESKLRRIGFQRVCSISSEDNDIETISQCPCQKMAQSAVKAEQSCCQSGNGSVRCLCSLNIDNSLACRSMAEDMKTRNVYSQSSLAHPNQLCIAIPDSKQNT